MSLKHTNELNKDNLIFALDIGTRTIIGIIGMQENDHFKVIASEVVAHKSRAMMDGQIHDIEQVAIAVDKTKKLLEKKIGMNIDKVSIAAAGRVLRTKQVNIQREIDPTMEIDRELIRNLEMEGMQLAQMQITQELNAEDNTQYYCVGYDILNYYLNNYIISSLIGHSGKTIAADILATFLPHTVVDSLYKVMNRVGLEVASLTLEPIASINVAIPKDLRLLNLALIDIGAGTSDIAITKGGSAVAYAMVPVAGDEITELICQNFLIDFNTAEKIKISLSTRESIIKFTDIMGAKKSINTEEILVSIRPAIEHLADTISNKIMEYNQKAPNAVFLVGGGSQIPYLPQLIAERLNLPIDRVALKDRKSIQNVKMSGKKLSGPDVITPIGIAVTAQMQKDQDFIDIMVMDRKIRLFNTRKLVASDALVAINFKAEDLIGKRGKPLVFTLDDEKKILKGDHGDSAQILLNGKIGNLETPIKHNDHIVINPSKIGSPAKLSIKEVLEYYAYTDSTVEVNGEIVPDDYFIKDGDILKTISKSTQQTQSNIECDSSLDEFDDNIGGGTISDEFLTINKLPISNHLEVYVNGEKLLIDTSKNDFMFVDIFNYIDFDLANPQGNIQLKLNGKTAGFADPIHSGDDIEIYWD